jgi:hypothetical protein
MGALEILRQKEEDTRLGMVVVHGGLHPSPARDDIPDMPKSRNFPDRALLIRTPFIDQVLAGSKTWEIRTRSTNVRGTIGLIRSGSGTVVGTCELVDVIGPLRYGEFKRNARKWGGKPSEVRRGDHLQFYAWVLRKAKRFRSPVPYRHPNGAIIWVRLTPKAIRPRIRQRVEA